MPDGKFRKEQLQLINGIYPDGELSPGMFYKVSNKRVVAENFIRSALIPNASRVNFVTSRGVSARNSADDERHHGQQEI